MPSAHSRDVGKALAIGVAQDVGFQLIALRTIYPLEALIVGFLVAVPYQVIRTVVRIVASRLASRS